MRYFFHVMNGQAIIDTDGLELTSLAEARTEAIRASASMLGTGDHVWSGEAWRMVVCDDTGTIVFGTSFAVDHHGFGVNKAGF